MYVKTIINNINDIIIELLDFLNYKDRNIISSFNSLIHVNFGGNLLFFVYLLIHLVAPWRCCKGQSLKFPVY